MLVICPRCSIQFGARIVFRKITVLHWYKSHSFFSGHLPVSAVLAVGGWCAKLKIGSDSVSEKLNRPET